MGDKKPNTKVKFIRGGHGTIDRDFLANERILQSTVTDLENEGYDIKDIKLSQFEGVTSYFLIIYQ